VDHAGGEVDVGPGQREYLRDAQAGVERGDDQQPVAGRASGEQPDDRVLPERALCIAGRGRSPASSRRSGLSVM
jgi:hypothetical protein